MSLHRWELAVVGGGVVGLATAVALREAGFDAGVIERGDDPVADPTDPRVYAVSPASARVLPPDWAQAEGVQAYRHMQVWQAAPDTALHFDAALVRAPALGWIAPESVLRAQLWARLPPPRRLARAEVETLTEHDDGVSLLLGAERVVRTRLVVACDGLRSPLRARAGIPVHQWGYAAEGLVATLQCERPHAETAWQRFLPDSVLALLPLSGQRVSLVWSTAQAAELQALTAEAFAEAVTEASQGVLGSLSLAGERQRFPLMALHAERYVDGRLVLAGDAAHSVHPLAGQGVNLGIADGLRLAQVLADARDQGRDWTAPRVLARYQRARRAANAELLALTDALSRGFSPAVPGLSALLGAGLGWVDRVPTLKAALVRRAMGAA